MLDAVILANALFEIAEPGEGTTKEACFAPAIGIPEDPVTGGAHCALVPYWAKRLGKSSFQAYQASARGGEIGCRLLGDRVELTGSVVFYLEGRVEL